MKLGTTVGALLGAAALVVTAQTVHAAPDPAQATDPASATAPGATSAPAPAAARAALADPTIVVATDGDDGAAGTVAAPLRTLQAAVGRAQPGDVIAVRGGTYALTTNIQILTSGTSAAPITLGPYQDERVIIDGDLLPASHTPVGGSIPRPQRGAIHQEASWWRIHGLELTKGPYGVYCDGCNDNAFTNLTTRDNYETGFQLQGNSSRNLIENLDSYDNHDPRKNGESADGLGIKEGRGEGNRVVGARLWRNADDGFDAWLFESAITIENSLAWGNGFNHWGFPDFEGDGNGFKMGGGNPGPAAAHTLTHSIAFDNAEDGITDNGNPGALTISRTTTFRNGDTGYQVNRSDSTLTANLSIADARAVNLGNSTAIGNSWNIGGDWGTGSVLSTDTALVTGDRAPDGSPPSTSFLIPRGGEAIGARL
ncbi:right-handed parallel beta-helix repeat-containing protein [Streptomyces xiamenensis]|uniref:right-handed parallel beta-helix repeat-containing protein n=1 Tax=Streptomyces xiamenensis TaxID=408015 RepID=UPI0035E21A31